MKKIKALFLDCPELKKVQITKDSEGDTVIECETSSGLTAIDTTIKGVRKILKKDRKS